MVHLLLSISGDVFTPANSAEELASADSTVTPRVSKIDGKYKKTILTDQIKVTKLNLEDFQSWSNGMELLLYAKILS